MSQPTDPESQLAEDIATFLRLEKELPDPPGELQAQIFTRLQATLGLPIGDGADPGQSPSPGTSGTGAPDSSTGQSAGSIIDSVDKVALGASHPLLRTIVAFTLGTGVGAGAHKVLDVREQRRAAPVVQPVVPVTPTISLAADASVEQAPPPLPDTPDPVAPPTPRPQIAPAKAVRDPQLEGRERDRALATERALIEQARTALSRGKNDVALAALERHARAHAHGALEEERESLLVQVLVDSDRFAEARAVAAQFRSRFPRSIFAPVVDEALRSIP